MPSPSAFYIALMSSHKRKNTGSIDDNSDPQKKTCTTTASSSSTQPPRPPHQLQLPAASPCSLQPLLEHFAVDTQWIHKAPSPVDNAELHHRLASAFIQLDPKGSEDLRKTLKALLPFGLVVHIPSPSSASPSVSSLPTLSLAQYLVKFLNDLLSSNEDKHPTHSFSFLSMQEIVRTKLFFHFIAFFLHVNIFLFSSQSKPHIFRAENATSSIGIVHHVDSYHGTSEYLALAEAKTPPKIPQSLSLRAP